MVAKLQGDKSASQSSMELYYPWISGPLRVSGFKGGSRHDRSQRAPNPSEFAPTCTRGPKKPKQTCTNSRPEALLCKLRTGTNLHKFAPPLGRHPSGGPTRSGGCKFGWVWSPLTRKPQQPPKPPEPVKTVTVVSWRYIFFVGQATGGQGARQIRQNRQNKKRGFGHF